MSSWGIANQEVNVAYRAATDTAGLPLMLPPDNIIFARGGNKRYRRTPSNKRSVLAEDNKWLAGASTFSNTPPPSTTTQRTLGSMILTTGYCPLSLLISVKGSH